ncbi:MAG: FAD-dependent oxidoreductase [Lachnospiraceae bacterium]|nr:FAD-dependent oxidoreductase [Lachnospiraceae bacterium]MDD3617143.1 FAD-dependent oxidoreductase [Lachnospiraceae bacterium]
MSAPYKIAGCTIPNRYSVSPVTTLTMYDEKGAITDKFIKYFETRAKGGFGLLVTGANDTDYQVDPYLALGTSPLQNPEAFVESSKKLTNAVHKYGAKVFCQLTLGLGRNYPGLPAPSENPVYNAPDQLSPVLTTEQIKQKISQFIESAKLVKEGGWDGIEVHAMHWGYLLDQFAMSLMNRRTDEYGGSRENRLRAARELVEGCHEVCGKDYPVGMRLGLKTYIKDFNKASLTGEGEVGRDLEESLECAKLLESYGYDYLSVDAGIYDSFYYACPPMYMPQGFMLDMAEACKKAVSIPVIAGGRMNNAEACAEAINAGKFDAVTMGRPQLADPEYPNKVFAGKVEKIRPCLGCNYGCFKAVCMDLKPITCAVNPAAGNEIEKSLKPGNGSKKVIVVGGGVGGMEASRTCALRGYDVTLYEKSGELGGHLIEAGAHSFKSEIMELNRWYQAELRDLKVNVVMNHEASMEELKSADADVIVLAVGSNSSTPPIPGLETATTSVEAIRHPEKIGHNVIIVGGGLVGCEIAYDEVLKGKAVTIIEALEDIMVAGVPAPTPNAMMMKDILDQHKVSVRTSCKAVEIKADGIVVESEKGGREELKGDTIISALGFRPNVSMKEALSDCGAQVFEIGDARRPANILQAVADGYEVANTI